MNNKPTTAEIIILASGAVALVASFLAWYDLGSFGGSLSAWDSGLFPLATYVGILGGAMAVVIALEAFANVKLPAKILSFSWPQIHLADAVFCALIALGFLIQDAGPDKGMGIMLSLLASAGLVAGAIMLDKERPGGVRVAPAASPGVPPPMAPPPPPPPA